MDNVYTLIGKALSVLPFPEKMQIYDGRYLDSINERLLKSNRIIFYTENKFETGRNYRFEVETGSQAITSFKSDLVFEIHGITGILQMQVADIINKHFTHVDFWLEYLQDILILREGRVGYFDYDVSGKATRVTRITMPIQFKEDFVLDNVAIEKVIYETTTSGFYRDEEKTDETIITVEEPEIEI